MTNKPRILILSLTYFPFIGGAEIAVSEITKRLDDNFDFDLICARLDKKLKKQEKINNINVYRLGFGFQQVDKYIFTFFGFFKALKLYSKNKYQIIWPSMAAYSSFAVLFKIFTKTKVILTLQEGDPLEYITNLKRFKLFKPVYKLYFKKVDQIQVISSFLAGWIKSLGVKENKIVIIPNGVDLKKFANLKKENNKEKIILTDSRLVEKNGLEDLIKSIKLLKTDAQLLIIGAGPLRKNLEHLTKELNLAKKIQFLGKIPYEKIQKYYAQADIFIRPSLSEGFGNVFIQAMAAQIPVIATPVGGIPDFLQDGETGWFCKVKNPKSIAEKINYLLDEKNQSEIKQVMTQAQKMVREKYNWDIITPQMNKIFQSLL